VMGQGIFLA